MGSAGKYGLVRKGFPLAARGTGRPDRLGDRQGNPHLAGFPVALLDGGPGDAMADLLASAARRILVPRAVERLAIDRLRALGKVVANRRRQLAIRTVRACRPPLIFLRRGARSRASGGSEMSRQFRQRRLGQVLRVFAIKFLGRCRVEPRAKRGQAPRCGVDHQAVETAARAFAVDMSDDRAKELGLFHAMSIMAWLDRVARRSGALLAVAGTIAPASTCAPPTWSTWATPA